LKEVNDANFQLVGLNSNSIKFFFKFCKSIQISYKIIIIPN